jgi:hypothetical protein
LALAERLRRLFLAAAVQGRGYFTGPQRQWSSANSSRLQLIIGTAAGADRLPRMMLKAIAFLAVILSALTLIPYGAHLFSLPNKINMTRDDYFVAQSIYRGWALLSFILIPAMLVNIVLAVMLRREPGFVAAVAGCICMAATLAVFFAFTYPANVVTQDWTVAQPDWETLRRNWEYSHAVNAALAFAAFCLIVLAAFMTQR